MVIKDKWIPDSLYEDMVENLPICTVDVLFFNKEKNKILLCKRANEPLKNIYFSIGGRLLKNENFREGAVRQAKKELGIDIDKNKLIWSGVSNEIHSNSIYQKLNVHNVCIYWGCIWSNGKIILDSQHSECKWFDILDKDLHPLIKKRIKNLISKL